MKYTDSNEAKAGDTIAIDENHRGVVVAVLDTGDYTKEHPAEEWAYLKKGILVDTDFGGLVHYLSVEHEIMTLIERGPATGNNRL